MKTKELISGIKWWSNLLKNVYGLNNHKEKPIWYDYAQKDDELVNEIIRRLEELEELRFRLKEMKMKDYVDQALVEELVKV